ncbi:MAG: hypothetical protein ACI97K_000722 [Glaciecola sp.]|jgi:hypothetical protein
MSDVYGPKQSRTKIETKQRAQNRHTYLRNISKVLYGKGPNRCVYFTASCKTSSPKKGHTYYRKFYGSFRQQ